MTAVQQLHKRDYFPKGKESKRRYRIWVARLTDRDGREPPTLNKKSRRDLPGRRYATSLRAHDQALLLVRWENEGTVFEVYDFEHGSLIGVYKRLAKSVDFTVIKGGK